ncbi:MAG: hypothetical protein FWG42_11450, partial [Clostridiales bacterium]|nr:hypothetical protein [Clostridiales bacterium]
YASISTASLGVARELGMTTVRGVALDDWDLANSASFLINRVLTSTGTNLLRDGQIYTGHDQQGQTNTRQALPEIVHELRMRGFGFMTLTELRLHMNFPVTNNITYLNFFQYSAIPVVNIDIQPAAPAEAFIAGDIKGSLTVEASSTGGAATSYQWYVNTTAENIGGSAIEGASGGTLALPEDLTEGTYYFYAVASAKAAASVASDPAKVVVARDCVNINLRANPVTYINSDAEYTLSLANVKNALAVELEFEIDAGLLAEKGIFGLSGFEPMSNVLWVHKEGGKLKGSLALALPSRSTAGLTSKAPIDVASFNFAPKAFGNASMKLTSAKVVGLADTTIYLDTEIQGGAATTVVAHSKYDLNRDGAVDALDLGIMLLYCGFKAEDPEWGTFVKVNDAWGNPVAASQCDVNKDGVIDMLDLIDLFIHYAKIVDIYS